MTTDDIVITYGGIGRMSYFLCIILALALFGVASFFAWGPSFIGAAAIVSTFAIFCVSTIRRLMNLGVSAWFVLLSIVPIANMFLVISCLALPQGYQETRRID